MLTFYFFLFIISCSNTSEQTILKWTTGQKKVTYTIYKGDTSNLVDILYKAYYPNGQIFKIGKIKDGLETGPWNYYYQSGELKSKGEYNEGQLDGKFNAYYDSGESEQAGKYLDGKLVSLILFNRNGTQKGYDEDLSKYLLDNPQKWTKEQIEEIRIDCFMVVEPNYDYAEEFCNCILDSLQRHCNYSDIKPMTENQRGIVLGYITQNQKDCFNLLQKKKKFR